MGICLLINALVTAGSGSASHRPPQLQKLFKKRPQEDGAGQPFGKWLLPQWHPSTSCYFPGNQTLGKQRHNLRPQNSNTGKGSQEPWSAGNLYKAQVVGVGKYTEEEETPTKCWDSQVCGTVHVETSEGHIYPHTSESKSEQGCRLEGAVLPNIHMKRLLLLALLGWYVKITGLMRNIYFI